jgi:TetR/AcrR family transcriptional repressor of nem operon
MDTATDGSDTRTMLLDVAERLTRLRGYNGYSFRDLAERVGVTTASIHYHFPTKGDLGRDVMKRYRERFMQALAAIPASSKAATPTPREQLRAFLELFDSAMRQGGACLCAPLAAEYESLPAPVQDEVRRFYTEAEGWLAAVLDKGRRAGQLRFDGPALAVARSLVAMVEGAMLAAGANADEARVRQAITWAASTLDAR